VGYTRPSPPPFGAVATPPMDHGRFCTLCGGSPPFVCPPHPRNLCVQVLPPRLGIECSGLPPFPLFGRLSGISYKRVYNFVKNCVQGPLFLDALTSSNRLRQLLSPPPGRSPPRPRSAIAGRILLVPLFASVHPTVGRPSRIPQGPSHGRVWTRETTTSFRWDSVPPF